MADIKLTIGPFMVSLGAAREMQAALRGEGVLHPYLVEAYIDAANPATMAALDKALAASGGQHSTPLTLTLTAAQVAAALRAAAEVYEAAGSSFAARLRAAAALLHAGLPADWTAQVGGEG